MNKNKYMAIEKRVLVTLENEKQNSNRNAVYNGGGEIV